MNTFYRNDDCLGQSRRTRRLLGLTNRPAPRDDDTSSTSEKERRPARVDDFWEDDTL